MRRKDSLENIIMLGKVEGRQERERLNTRWIESIEEVMNHGVEFARAVQGCK